MWSAIEHAPGEVYSFMRNSFLISEHLEDAFRRRVFQEQSATRFAGIAIRLK
jgi:hypothetical protein